MNYPATAFPIPEITIKESIEPILESLADALQDELERIDPLNAELLNSESDGDGHTGG